MSTDSQDNSREGGRGWGAIIGWGAYLGCSWTWCIGMFLPVLLVWDYGPWAMVVFAVPNIVGAAAMGFVLKRPVDEAWRAQHAGAMKWFMHITLVFQWYFLGFVVMFGGMWWLAFMPFVLAVIWKLCRSRWRILGVAVWAVSLGCAAVYLNNPHPSVDGLFNLTPRHAPIELVWLAPVCFFGFLLCPYLDMTFHRARGAMDPHEARWAFALGFGVVFASMIGFTWLYAPMLLFLGPGLGTTAAAAVAVHMTVQVGFTTCAFLEADDHGQGNRPAVASRLLLTLAAGFAFGALPVLGGRFGVGANGYELIYRCFMAFYGLVFPAYVWLCVIGASGKRGKRLAVFAGAVALAAPCYWMGFIEGQAVWLVPGLLIVLAARLLVRGDRAITQSAEVPAAPGAA